MPHDRVAAAATAIMQIVATAPKDELRQAIESFLRDEFADVARQLVADVYGGEQS
jgi:hypothetical protein